MAKESFEQFANRLFEFELCYECGGDASDHEPRLILGNWFALCKIATNPHYKITKKPFEALTQ